MAARSPGQSIKNHHYKTNDVSPISLRRPIIRSIFSNTAISYLAETEDLAHAASTDAEFISAKSSNAADTFDRVDVWVIPDPNSQIQPTIARPFIWLCEASKQPNKQGDVLQTPPSKTLH